MEELSSGELFLKEIMQGLIITKDWASVRKKIADQLIVYTTAGYNALTKVPEIDAISPSLRYQLFLEAAGPDMRELWGAAHEEAYKPELLREPYLTAASRRDLMESISKFLAKRIEGMVGEESSKHLKELQLTKQQYFVTAKIRAQQLLQHSRETKAAAQVQEDIGSALTTLLRKEDLLVHLLATAMTPQSAYDPRKDDKKGDQYKSGLAMGVLQLTAEDQGALDVRETLERSDKDKLNDLCLNLRGVLLSSSMRTELWGFSYLVRQPYEAPTPQALSLVRELPRLTSDKGIDLSSTRGLERSSMFSMIRNAVDAGIADALPLSVTNLRDAPHTDASRPNSATPSWLKRSDENKENTKLGHLASRARFMVHAIYALNDEFNSRVVMLAILLLWHFPDEPPTGEKILRIYQRIALECLPSEQLQHEYSLATVAHEAWALLLVRDQELAHFLQNYDVYKFSRDQQRLWREQKRRVAGSNPNSEYATSDDESAGNGKQSGKSNASNQSAKGPTGGLSKTSMDPLAMEVPRSFLLLRGWLEDGFMGWLGEYTVLYIWDQMVLFGAHPAIFREILPIFCCILLRAMRVSLLSLPPGRDLIEMLRTFGRQLRTRNVVEALRCDPLCAKFAPPPHPRAKKDQPAPPADASAEDLLASFTRASLAPVSASEPASEEKGVALTTQVSALSMGSAGGGDGDSPQPTPLWGQTPFPDLDLTGLSTHATSRPASAGDMASVRTPKMADLGTTLTAGSAAGSYLEIAGGEESKAREGGSVVSEASVGGGIASGAAPAAAAARAGTEAGAGAGAGGSHASLASSHSNSTSSLAQ